MEVSSDVAGGDLIITIHLSALDVLKLKHDLAGQAGIVDWFATGPSAQKIVACAKRMDQEGRVLLDNDPTVESIPANLDARLQVIAAHPDYKDREARNAAAE